MSWLLHSWWFVDRCCWCVEGFGDSHDQKWTSLVSRWCVCDLMHSFVVDEAQYGSSGIGDSRFFQRRKRISHWSYNLNLAKRKGNYPRLLLFVVVEVEHRGVEWSCCSVHLSCKLVSAESSFCLIFFSSLLYLKNKIKHEFELIIIWVISI